MSRIMFSSCRPTWAALATASLLAACGGGGGGASGFGFVSAAPSLGGSGLSEARPGTLQSCSDLAGKAAFGNTVYTSVTSVAAGTLVVAGASTPVPEHCLVQGQMNQRTSSVDGKTYAIGFEMRLPNAWNGRSLRWRRWAQRV